MTVPFYAARPVALVVAVQAAVLLAMAPFYGPHRDELYFASAGQRLAWGYPDQPSFTPFLARLAAEVDPHGLVVLRLPSIAAMGALVLLTAWFARLLGGARTAQVLTAVVTAFSAFPMAVGHRLSTATFDTLVWTTILVLVAQALIQCRPRLWLAAGFVAGVGLNNKHAVAFLLVAIVVALAVDPRARVTLRTPWPWLAGLLALAMWVPNLVWQADQGWPSLDLAADIADENAGLGGRLALIGQAIVMFSPLVALVVVAAGLIQLLRRPAWVAARPVAVATLVVTAVFLVTGGKGYYLAGAFPPLVAAGCVVLTESRLGRRPVLAGGVLALSAVVAWPAVVPVLPADVYVRSFYPAIDDDQPETIGWPQHADTVRSVIEDLEPAQRRAAVVLADNYGEAGAMEWYDVGRPVYSGHNGWQDWGPPPAGSGPVVVLGFERPEDSFTGCTRRATLGNDEGADNEEQGQGVWLCVGPRGSWAEQWPTLSYYSA